jgi:hypothetical protein
MRPTMAKKPVTPPIAQLSYTAATPIPIRDRTKTTVPVTNIVFLMLFAPCVGFFTNPVIKDI